MLPVSGALQLKQIRGAMKLRPMISQSSPYSQFFSPAPYVSSGEEQVPQSLRLRPLADLDQDLGVGDAGRRPRRRAPP